MNRKWFVRAIAIVLALVLLGSVIFGVVSTISARAVSMDEIDELKAQAETLEERQSELAEEKASVEYENMTTLAKKAVLDEQVSLTEQEIANVSATITAYEQLIVDKEAEVAEAQAAEDKQWELYKTRMRAMEESGPISYLAVIFEADSFADFLARIDFVGQVMRYDKSVYEQWVEYRNKTISAKEELEQTKANLEAERQKLEQKQAELEQQISDAQNLILQQQASIDTYMAYIQEVEQQRADLDAEIEQKIAEYEAEQERSRKAGEAAEAAARAAAEAARAAAAAASITTSSDESSDSSSSDWDYGDGEWGGEAVGTGTFIWPAPASNIVTSLYGTRFHPIYHYYTTHNGVDIGAGYGTEVLAADSGVVMVSEYHWSFGNYIMINHGNGYVTLYGHMSTLIASAGENVYQGETIGLVGSTGDSTGPHLHFEVRVNGSRIDPLQFFSGYVVSE